MLFHYNSHEYSGNYTSEEELVFQYIHTGQNHFLGQLYVKCSKRVYGQCLSMVKDPALAEDYTQDIFLKLIPKLLTFNGGSRFSTWLSSITHNYCLDQYRANKRRFQISTDSFPELADESPSAYCLPDEPHSVNRLMQSYSCLPADERMILRMRYAENLCLAVIAGKLNITVSATKMRLLRTRKRLRLACQEVNPVHLQSQEQHL